MSSHRRRIPLLAGIVAGVLSVPVTAAACPDDGSPRETAGAHREEVVACRPLSDAHPVKLNLKPDTEIGDLVAWIATITCRQFVVPGSILATPRKVTIVAPQFITRDEAYELFLSALDSVNLTVVASGKFLRVIENSKAKNSSVPLYGFVGEGLWDGRVPELVHTTETAAPPSKGAASH